MFDGIGAPELVIILVVFLLLFGVRKLPGDGPLGWQVDERVQEGPC